MSKLAFNGEGRKIDYDKGYTLYANRSRKGEAVKKATYKKIVRGYCREMAEKLYDEGFVDLPNGMGTIAAAMIRRKPQFIGKRYVGIGKMDWETGMRDNSRKAFGIVFLPKWDMKGSLRCYGFVANRRLFQRMKQRYESFKSPWEPIEFNDSMI